MGFAKPNSCKTTLVFDMRKNKRSAVQWGWGPVFFQDRFIFMMCKQTQDSPHTRLDCKITNMTL